MGSDARTLFKLLDHNQSELISISEFLTGCYKLQGEARSLDMKIMQLEVTFLKDTVLSINKMLWDLKDSVSKPQGCFPHLVSAGLYHTNIPQISWKHWCAF